MENLHKTITKIKALLLFFTLLCVFVSIHPAAQAQTPVWEKALSGTASDKVTDVATDASGNSYVLGYSNQQITLNGVTYGSSSATNYFPYVIKYDKAGVLKWVHVPTGLPATYNITSCAITLDTSGRVIYSGISQASAATTIVFGPRAFNEATFTQAGGTEGFIVALDSTGAAQWVDRFGNSAAATISYIALGFNKFDNSLIYAVSAATASTPLTDLYFFASPYFGSSIDLGAAYLTGTQESWYGKINTLRGANLNQNYRFGGNQYSREWIEDIATDSLGNVYLGCTYFTTSPNGFVSDLYYNGGNTTIPGGTTSYGLLIKLRFDLFYLGYARFAASADSRLRAIAVRPTGEAAYIIDNSPGYVYGNVLIGGVNSALGSPWQNTVQSAGTGSSPSYFFSGKGIAYDNSGNIWAAVGGHCTSGSFAWSYTPAYTTASPGSVAGNPGLMLLKLNYSSGTTASWLDYRYIRESANNSNSQGSVTTPGMLSVRGSSLYVAGTHANSITPAPLAAMTTAGGTDLDGHLIKLGCEPAFTSQPAGAYLCNATTVTLAATVSDATATFQWYRNGAAISGATNDTLILTAPTAADTGAYILYATNACGTTASEPARLSYTVPGIPGLAAWYRFDNNTADSSGNVNDATASNAVTATTDRFAQNNTAYSFNGTSSSVTLPATLLGNAQGKSFSMWFKRTGSGVVQPLITYQVPTPGAWNPLAYIGTDNVLRGWYYQGGTTTWTSGITIDTNWHHLAVTTTANNQTAYLDGAQVATMIGTINTGTSSLLRIGAGYMGGIPGVPATNTYYYNGKIDEVRFYNSTLSAAQVSQLYTQDIGFATQPQGRTVCAGASVTLTAAASGSATYQWQKNGVNISGATTATYTDANVQAADTGSYTCTITAPCTGQSVTSNVAYLALSTGGTITTQPADQAPCAGAQASFAVAVTGGTATYQWRRNNTNITGATAATYTVPAASAADTGTYVCVVTTGCGAQNSATATLTLAPATTITANPLATTVCAGAQATLTIAATGAGTLTYVWKKGTTTVTNGTNTTGATTATLGITAAGAGDAGSYTVVVTGTCGSATSAAATLALSAVPAITQQPQPQTICAGAALTLSVAASGAGLTYQWQKGTTNISGETSPSLTRANAAVADSGSYTCVITYSCGTVRTNTVHVTVNPLPVAAISPATAAVCTGSATTLTASGGGTYAWSNALGTNAAASVSPVTATTYTVTVTLNSCTATASRLVAVYQLPAITLSPVSGTICPGASQLLTAGGGTSYTWSNGLGTGNSKTVTPASVTTYTVTGTDANSCQSTASATISLYTATGITTQPAAQTACTGSTVTFTVGAAGTGLSYQWRKNGVNINTATAASYAIASTAAADSGRYDVIVTGTCGRDTSAVAPLAIVSSASISQQPASTAACAGGTVTLSVAGTGGNNTTYQWKRGTTNVGTGATLTLSNVTASDAGSYTVVISGSCGTVTSSPVATVTIYTATTGTISRTICAGSSYSFDGRSLTASGVYRDTLQNANGCDSILTLNLTVSPALQGGISRTICAGSSYPFHGRSLIASGVYRDTLQNANGCDSILTLNLTVSPALQGGISRTICAGSSYSFDGRSLTASGVYRDTLQNANGCDSILTLNLTVSPALQGGISRTICAGSSYTFHGQALTAGGVYKDTVQTTGGCDSIITLQLTVLPRLSSAQSAVICSGAGIVFHGQTITTAGQYLDTLTSVAGCDSFITLTVTVAQPTAASLSLTACGSYTFGGQTLTTGGTYADTVTNAAGCDSVVTLTLTITRSTTAAIYDTVCSGSTYTFGIQPLTTSGTYTRTIPNAAGCDSVITLYLYVRPALTIAITASGSDLSATAGFASYQWQLDGAGINGATLATYTAVADGSYTVSATDVHSCPASSAAYQVTGVGIGELSPAALSIYPNPATDQLTILSGEKLTAIEVSDISGRIIKHTAGTTRLDIASLAPGMYTIHVQTASGKTGARKFTKL